MLQTDFRLHSTLSYFYVVASPNDDTTPRPSSFPSGSMTRARVKALHEKVNSILLTLDLDTTLDGMLPQVDVLCVIGYKSREECVKVDTTSDKERGPRQLELAAHDRHCRPCTPALPTGAPRHCRPEHPDTAGLGTPALPPEAHESKHRPRPTFPPQYHRHCRPHPS
jgi:hypothetical protein